MHKDIYMYTHMHTNMLTQRTQTRNFSKKIFSGAIKSFKNRRRGAEHKSSQVNRFSKSVFLHNYDRYVARSLKQGSGGHNP